MASELGSAQMGGAANLLETDQAIAMPIMTTRVQLIQHEGLLTPAGKQFRIPRS